MFDKWPSYTVGAFFLALIIYDMIINDWIDLPYHAIIGLLLTGIYTLICVFINDTIAGAALLIPAVALIGFMVALWMSGENLKSRGCCVRCTNGGEMDVEESPPTKVTSGGTTTAATATTGATTGASACPNKLNATPLV